MAVDPVQTFLQPGPRTAEEAEAALRHIDGDPLVLRTKREQAVLERSVDEARRLFDAEPEPDGYLRIAAALAECHPEAVNATDEQRWLKALGDTGSLDGPEGRAKGERVLVWVRDALSGGAHPALFDLASMLSRRLSAAGHDEVFRVFADTRFADEALRTRARDLLRAGYIRLFSRLFDQESHEAFARIEELATRALTFDPDDVHLRINALVAIYKLGRHDEALAIGGEWLAADPTNAQLLDWVVLSHARRQEWTAAIELFHHHAPRMTPDLTLQGVLSNVMHAYIQAGRPGDALQALGPWLRLPIERGPISISWVSGKEPAGARIAANIAGLYAHNGDLARCLEFARGSVALGKLPEYFRTDSDFAPFLETPEFRLFFEELDGPGNDEEFVPG